MDPDRVRRKAEGDQQAVLFILSIIVGAVAGALIGRLIGRGPFGDALAFFGMWAAMFPFARRTWAVDLPIWRYWAGAATGAVVAGGLRVLFL